MEEQLSFLNCRFCGAKMPENNACCGCCGAPNQQDPLPWYKTLGLRFTSSLVSKNKSVWADRLASLMPIHFLASLAGLLYLFFLTPNLGSANLVFGLASGISMLFILIFYPDWYKSDPDERKETGLLYFIIVIVFAFIVNNYIHLLNL